VARKIENSHRHAAGVKHIYTKVQDGTATVTAEFRLEKPTQEALDDVRDAVSRVRADLPGDLRDPVVAKMDLAGAADPGLHRGLDAHGRRGAVLVRRQRRHQALLSVRGVGAVNRVGGVTREVHVELDPARLQALGATAADISRQLRQVQQEAPAAAPTWAARAVGAHHRHRADGRRAGARWRSAVRRPRMRLDQVATVSDTVAEQRSRRCSTASRWWASRSRAARAPARWTWAPACAPRWPSCARPTPTWKSPRPSTSSTR
jgi:multidrug efflux pump subunit AcrB